MMDKYLGIQKIAVSFAEADKRCTYPLLLVCEAATCSFIFLNGSQIYREKLYILKAWLVWLGRD
jgi:hypothetical protein